MARSVDEIKAQIDESLAARPSLAAIIGNPSQNAIWKAIRFAIAVCIGVFEQIIDQHKVDTEAAIASGIPGTALWLRKKVLEFQYDSVTPQVIELDVNLNPVYQVVDASKRIVSLVVIRYGSGLGNVYVAKNDPPEPLTVGELASLQSYLTDGGSSTDLALGLGFAGIAFTAISSAPDQLQVKATVYYDGRYDQTIRQSVFDAITAYGKSLDIAGYVRVTEFINVVLAVEGVKDIRIEKLGIRADAGGYPGIYLIDSFTEATRQLLTNVGYFVEETTSGHTWTDEITFSAT